MTHNDNFGTRGMSVRVHSNGTPVGRRSKTMIFIALVAFLLVINLMTGLFSTISGGCYQVLEMNISDQFITIFNGDDYQLTASVITSGQGQTEYRWESSDDLTVSVDENGKITGLSDGAATITVTELNSGEYVTCDVTVLALSSMEVKEDYFVLGVGEQLTVSAFSGNGRQVEYFTADPSIATVDPNGSITGVAPGYTEVEVTSVGCESKLCTVEVLKAPSTIVFETSLDMCAGETRVVTASAVEGEYSNSYKLSTDSSIIQIAEDGTLTALEAGTATIIAEAYNGVVGKGEVTVRNEPTSISLSVEDKSLFTGETTELKPKENTGFCQQFVYGTSDPNIATVDENGVVTATGKGSANISCETYNGVKATCKVSVDIVDYTKEYTSDKVERNCRELVAAYPELITMESCGTSTCGTDIILLKMGTGEKKALITGGIHSREDITVNYVMRCVEEYAEAYYSDSGRYGSFKLRDLLGEWTLYIVPLMNPDGVDIVNGDLLPLYNGGQELAEEDSFHFKNTATGVNLNRNFPFYWGYTDPQINATTPDVDSYIGASEASEPETQAMIKLCEANEFEWLYSFHVQGNMLYWADSVNSNAEKAEMLSNRLVVNCGFNLMRSSTIAGASGGFENWFRQQYDKPGFCIELIEDKWATSVNKYFDKKINWSKTRYAIVLGMVYG